MTAVFSAQFFIVFMVVISIVLVIIKIYLSRFIKKIPNSWGNNVPSVEDENIHREKLLSGFILYFTALTVFVCGIKLSWALSYTDFLSHNLELLAKGLSFLFYSMFAYVVIRLAYLIIIAIASRKSGIIPKSYDSVFVMQNSTYIGLIVWFVVMIRPLISG